MTTSASTVAWIGASGLIIGAAIAALASWITAVVTSRHAAGEASDDRRRVAYAAFLGALDEIIALYLLSPVDFGQQLDTDPAFAQSVRQALSSIAHTSVAVLLAGSQKARNAVQGIDSARWGVYEALINPAKRAGVHPLMKQFIDVKTKITDLGREELAGPSPLWKIRGRHGPGIR